MKRFLIIDGEKFPILNMTFEMNGEISTISVSDGYIIRRFVDVSSKEIDVEKIDFSKAYFEEETEAIKKISVRLDKVKEDLSEIIHASIPSVLDEYELEEVKEAWALFHLVNAYKHGLEFALNVLKEK